MHGLPETIVADNGCSFISEEFQYFCGVDEIQLITSLPYHSSTNGLAGRAVPTVSKVKRIVGGTLKSKL